MLGLLILQFGMFVTLVLQCHGLFVTYKLLEMKLDVLYAFKCKKSCLMRKKKHAQLRRLRRKHKSVWVMVNGRTDRSMVAKYDRWESARQLLEEKL